MKLDKQVAADLRSQLGLNFRLSVEELVEDARVFGDVKSFVECLLIEERERAKEAEARVRAWVKSCP